MESEALDTSGRVKALFEEVCDLPTGEREARLALRADEPAVVAEVRALLAHETDGHSHFAQPVVAAIGRLASDQLREGDMLGAWRLEKEIGHGGMGKVFSARRADGHFEQRAAIKLLRGVPTANALEYLARERQILAQLSHPHIARLLDGGATPGGQPYLVMDYIEGVPIDRHCIDQRLPVAAILELFAAICDAVSFAHAQLVVHCDLKPTNILVDRGGRPVLLDFGIARMLGSGGLLEAPTGSSDSPAYTPRYASPEQRAGQPVSTASDVFSLGVMLGELIAESGPAELRAVVGKATHPDPSQRYVSARALARDLERFLSKHPLEAVAPTPAYRARKLAQRRWPWFIVAAAFLFTVSAFTLRLVAERDRAQAAEGVAVKERDATVVAQQQAERERDRAGVAEHGTAVERDRAIAAEHTTAIERDRAVAAEARAVAGRDLARQAEREALAQRELARSSQAAATQVNEFLLSIFGSEELGQGSPDMPAIRIVDAAHARVEGGLGGQPQAQIAIYSALANIYRNMGRPREAVRDYERAIALERAQARPLKMAELLSELASLRATFGEQILAEKDAREALALRVQHAGPESSEAAASYQALGALLASRALYTESEEQLLRALTLRMQHHGARSAEVASTHHSLGQLYRYRQTWHHRAPEHLLTAISIREELFGADHRLTLTSRETLGNLYRETGRLAESETVLRKTLAARKALHGPHGHVVAEAHLSLGSTLVEAGRPREGAAELKAALEARAAVDGRETTGYGYTAAYRGAACWLAGDYRCAEETFRHAIPVLRKNLTRDAGVIARHAHKAGLFFTRSGRPEEALPMLVEAQAIRVRQFGSTSFSAIEAALEASQAEALMGRREDALARLAWAESNVSSNLREPLRIDFLHCRGLVLAALGETGRALADLAEAEQRHMLYFGEGALQGWLIALDRATLLASVGRKAEAATLAHDVGFNIAATQAPDSPRLVLIQELQARAGLK